MKIKVQKYYTLNKAIILLMALFFANTSFTQPQYFGSWNIVNAEYYLNNKFSIWSEVQLRSQKFYKDYYYYELKAGANYKINKSASFLVGTGQYATYSNGGDFKSPVNHEFRLWEQLTLVNNINIVKLEHRYRIEQRWRGDEYRNRFRYRLNPIIPINNSTITKGTLFITAFDEIFFTDQGQYFERNRFFAGLGFQMSKHFTIQTGWIRQSDLSADNQSSSKDYLQTTLLIKLHQVSDDRNIHPSTMD